MMTKEAQNQIIANSFQDELFKIAAADVLGDPNVDWDNLSDEQLEKLAKWFPGKFLARGLGRGVKAVKDTAKAVGKGAKATGKYVGNKFKDVGAGAKQVVEGVGDVAKGTAKTVGGAVKGTAEIGKDVVEGAAKTVGKAGKAVAGAAAAGGAAVAAGTKKYMGDLKNEFQTGAGTKVVPGEGGGDGLPGSGKDGQGTDENKGQLMEGKGGVAAGKQVNPSSGNIKSEKTPFERNNPGETTNNDPDQTTEGETSAMETAAKIPSKGMGAKPKRSNFGNAFAAARKAGKSEFTWNGRQYNTKMA
tara:strand:- start:74 stop:979 length:906 start_codon:yes stop_codon:yes gene_type:complete